VGVVEVKAADPGRAGVVDKGALAEAFVSRGRSAPTSSSRARQP
jgi:hypothetical protein